MLEKTPKTLSYLVEVANELRKGALSPSELEAKLNIPHRSLFRVLNCLKDIGVVRKRDDGKYEFESWQVFLDREGYTRKLKHSEELLKPIIERRELTSIEWVLNNKYLIQHLHSGYDEIHGKYEEWRRREEEYRISRERFEDAVRKYVAKHGFEIVFYEKLEEGRRQVSHLIYEDVASYIRRKDLENMRIVWREGWVWDDYRRLALAREEGLIGEVEKLIYGLVHSENVKNALKEVDIAMEKRSEAYSNYRNYVEWLALKVKHGEPLEGYCDLCPRIVIK
jgi:hypothetical protein